jgi:hypothetical protein
MLGFFHIHQPDTGVMHQSRRLQSLAGFLLRQPGRGKFAELVIDKWKQLLRRARITLLNLRE